ncbi:hypothetical protein BABINDRAFT_160285 [Babjeviella inositovora NRRL Y-12698]|uniref:Uncharacterized protein n=1 Tax=Babjeviella inositovora NRRL Y-12698 TaxID=984486 RepID=A0A1E3QWM0_9ASCO|nr:uncharacterized protein BABINDRAFT_160285 [Babjeviella inositovora NRRL Y-12698]ODQ82089.1 hypothetical protein BABINDRAFT_160285 [Babjeviella inositovora NRRL Y-12698]
MHQVLVESLIWRSSLAGGLKKEADSGNVVSVYQSYIFYCEIILDRIDLSFHPPDSAPTPVW